MSRAALGGAAVVFWRGLGRGLRPWNTEPAKGNGLKPHPLNKHQRDAAAVAYSATPSAETVCGIITPTVMSIEQRYESTTSVPPARQDNREPKHKRPKGAPCLKRRDGS